MIINMRDAASILAWYRVYPERHGPQLALMAKLMPRFADAIREEGQMARAERTARLS